MRKPNFFIVGAPKTGTTSFYAYLDGHPDVFMSPVKEPNFFSPDVMGTHRQSRWKYPEETDGYLTLYENARDEKRVGEASTSYLVSHAAPQAVHDFAPDALIIAMVRHPVDLMYSLHNERVLTGLSRSPTSRRHWQPTRTVEMASACRRTSMRSVPYTATTRSWAINSSVGSRRMGATGST